MNILICDDNHSVRDMIQRIFNQHGSQNATFYFAQTLEEATEIIDQKTIDLAFLDIQLTDDPKDAGGLEIGRRLFTNNSNAEIVMVTSHDDYALISFEIHPYAYISKPVDINLLIEVIHGVLQKMARKTETPLMNRRRNDTGKLFICVNKEMFWIPYDDILYVEKVGKELIIHTSRTAQTVRWTLSKIEEMLPKEFLRVHKSYIVNSRQIQRISEIGDRTYEITFYESNKLALLSRYKASELFQLLGIPE